MKAQNFKTLSLMSALMLFTFTNNIYADPGGNADGTSTGETGVNVTTGTNSVGGNCGNGPHTHAGNATCPNKKSDTIPLDGGISFLLAAAAFFGIKKLRGHKKNVM